MKIGDQLQKQRKSHHMSQNELAEKLHLTRQSISKWENGTTLPSFANVIAISEIFDVSLDELIKGDAALMDKLKDDGKIKLNRIETIVIWEFLVVSYRNRLDYRKMFKEIAPIAQNRAIGAIIVNLQN